MNLLTRVQQRLKSQRKKQEEEDKAGYMAMSTVGKDSPISWVRHSSQIAGWMFEGEPEYLYELAKKSPEGHILEIGSWCGKSACLFAGASIDRGDSSCIFCVDTFRMDGTPDQKAYHQRIHPREGTFYDFIRNAECYGFAERVIPLGNLSTICLPPLTVPLRLAFVDGRHDYAGVMEDLSLVVDKIVPDGYIALHDATIYWPDVERASEEFFASRPDYQFVEQFESVRVYRRHAA